VSKVAVVLFNLGGPDKAESIRPFLFNFFMDKNIIRAPQPLRWAIATLISRRRSKREAGKNYAALGGRSPLLENTQAQARALQAELGDNYKVFVCMRYWHPMADAVAKQVRDFAPERIVLLPLYPQYSTTTTRSSFQSWDKAAHAAGLNVPTARICCYPLHDGFINASAALVKGARAQAPEKARVLFSAHGLPEDVITDGDPYQWQCEQSARAIAVKAGLADSEWVICYQSRVGPKKWLGPSTEEEVRRAGADGVPVIIYPHAFVSEHVETLVEIEEEYRQLAKDCGAPYFARVPTTGIEKKFIAGLAALVRERAGDSLTCGAGGTRLCPPGWRRCAMTTA